MKGIISVKFDHKLKEDISNMDAIIGIVYYICYLFYLFLFGLILFKTQIYNDFTILFNNQYLSNFIFNIPFSVISITPIFLIIKLKKQSIKTIGIKNGNVLNSILLGIIGFIPIIVIHIIFQVRYHLPYNINILDGIWIFLYQLICIAFIEELIFRGFLQTRIQGLIHGKWFSIIIVGLLFGLSHVPFQMIQNHIGLIDFIKDDIIHLIFTCFIHIYLVYIYTRYNNIIASTIVHVLINFNSVFI